MLVPFSLVRAKPFKGSPSRKGAFAVVTIAALGIVPRAGATEVVIRPGNDSCSATASAADFLATPSAVILGLVLGTSLVLNAVFLVY